MNNRGGHTWDNEEYRGNPLVVYAVITGCPVQHYLLSCGKTYDQKLKDCLIMKTQKRIKLS